MTATWNRQVSLVFSDPNGDGIIDLSDSGVVLNIGFTVERNLDTEPSTMSATVHNLSRDTQEKLSGVNGWTVELVAGYGTDPDYDYISGNTNAIFKGKVNLVRHRREPPLLATDIEANDGGEASGKFVTRHFPKGTTVGTVTKWLQEQSGLGAGNIAIFSQVGNVDALPNRLKNGMTIKGYVMDELGDLARSREVRVSSQNGEIVVLPPGVPLAGVPITEVSPETGLIGYPYVDNEGVLTLNHRLLPNVFPGSPITVKSEFVTGDFVVDRAVYSGSLWDEDFNLEIEGTAAI
jgi:hypothetical protein